MARTYGRWTAIVGGFMLLAVLINSGAARSSSEVGMALAAAIIGLAPMLVVGYGLRRGSAWGRYAAFALPMCQAAFAAAMLQGAGPARLLSPVGQLVRGLVALQVYQCPVTAGLALFVWWRSRQSV
jgi:hypothetical protein